jgi:acyl transferase domain-containing protein
MKIYGEIDGMSFRSWPQENIISPTEAGYLRLYEDYYSRHMATRKQVRYVDGFASSHRVVDKWELDALTKTYKNGTFLGNSKTEFGYYRTANPAVVISKLMLMARNRTLLPMHSYSPESSMLAGESSIKAVTSRLDMKPGESLYMATNFSGLGGIHGHAVVRTLPLWMGTAVSGSKPLAAQEVHKESTQSAAPAAAAKKARICALLSGQGAQSAGMMKALYESNADIRKIMDRGEEIFRASRGYSILEMMFGSNEALHSTENTQVAIFLSSASVFAALAAKGFQPRSLHRPQRGRILCPLLRRTPFL